MKSVVKLLSKRGPLRILKRLAILSAYLSPAIARGFRWAFKRTEDSNFYYDVTERNLRHLNHFLAATIGAPFEAAKTLSDEIRNSEEFSDAVKAFKKDRPRLTSFSFAPGRRIGWYQLVRITKPRVVLETGVHQGVGALTICLALKRNALEGHPGRYIGTDINPQAGALISKLDFDFAEVKIGDSIESIENLDCEVDLYISDSDHTAGYEKLELLAVEKKLAKGGLVLSDNAHATDVLEEWSVERGRRFNFFSESPEGHWYPGAGIGISTPR
jgi:predicted O-methyltransferase YrrM